MIITKEMLDARIVDLRKRIDKLQADLNATVGALQDCNFWRAQLETPENE